MIPLLWLIAGVVLIAVELVSGTFVLLMLGIAALAGAGASALGAPLGVDVAVFGISAVALVLLARPALQRRVRSDAAVNAGPRALLGTTGEVVEPITGGDPGTVRIAGALWTARALHDGPDAAVLTTGDPVVVVDIRGATAVVTAASAGPAHPSRPPLQGES